MADGYVKVKEHSRKAPSCSTRTVGIAPGIERTDTLPAYLTAGAEVACRRQDGSIFHGTIEGGPAEYGPGIVGDNDMLPMEARYIRVRAGTDAEGDHEFQPVVCVPEADVYLRSK